LHVTLFSQSRQGPFSPELIEANRIAAGPALLHAFKSAYFFEYRIPNKELRIMNFYGF
jgi:hypothetical protein